MKKILREQKGFALITVIFAMLVMSILGVAILSVTTSNFNLTKLDSKSQSAYYIAEAGINHMIDEISSEAQEKGGEYGTSIDFFDYLDGKFSYSGTSPFTLDYIFEDDSTKANVTVIPRDNENEDVRDYLIESVGSTGNSKRTVSSVISVAWEGGESYEGDFTVEDFMKEVFVYGSSDEFNFKFGGSEVNGKGGTIIAAGLKPYDLNGGTKLNVTNMFFNASVKMDGGSASFGNKDEPGKIYIDGDLDLWSGKRDVYGDVYVNGNFRLKDAKIHGDVYVNGNLDLGWTPEIHKNIYYTGNLTDPDNYNNSILSKCIKVDSVPGFTIPSFDIGLYEESWYAANGYEVLGNVTNQQINKDVKLFVNSFSGSTWDYRKSIIIVSKGDINLTAWPPEDKRTAEDAVTGVLISLTGSVNVTGYFSGVIIANDRNESSGGTMLYMKNLNDFFPDGKDMPITITPTTGTGSNGSGTNPDPGNGTGNGGISTGGATITIKSPIREK